MKQTLKNMVLNHENAITIANSHIQNNTDTQNKLNNNIKELHENIIIMRNDSIDHNKRTIGGLEKVQSEINEKVKSSVHSEFKSFESRLESSILEVKKDFEKEEEMTNGDSVTEEDLKDLEELSKSFIKKNYKKVSQDIKKNSNITILKTTILNIVITISSIVTYDFYLRNFITNILN